MPCTVRYPHVAFGTEWPDPQQRILTEMNSNLSAMQNAAPASQSQLRIFFPPPSTATARTQNEVAKRGIRVNRIHPVHQRAVLIAYFASSSNVLYVHGSENLRGLEGRGYAESRRVERSVRKEEKDRLTCNGYMMFGQLMGVYSDMWVKQPIAFEFGWRVASGFALSLGSASVIVSSVVWNYLSDTYIQQNESRLLNLRRERDR